MVHPDTIVAALNRAASTFDWPNGLDLTSLTHTTAVKTHGLRECKTDGTADTSALSSLLAKPSVPTSPASPASSEKFKGRTSPYDAGHALPDAARDTNFGSAANKLVTITTMTSEGTVLLHNTNAGTTSATYKQLPSTPATGGIAIDAFQPSCGPSPPPRTELSAIATSPGP